jgi:hypothetical protein
MKYCFNAEKVSLEDLKNRIVTTDLVPSRAILLDGLYEKLKELEKKGFSSLANLRKELKDNKRLFAVADQTGIDRDYLALLRREAESYIPKPFPLKEFDWIPANVIAKLDAAGICNTAHLFENPDPAQSSGVDRRLLNGLMRCADLTRIQWISPLAARMLLEAGYDTPAKVAAADASTLDEAMNGVNVKNQYFKGRIGLRDIKRLIHAAKYVELWY